MDTEGRSRKKEKTNSADHGFGPGRGMREMMNACFAKGGHPDCYVMMKGMIEKMGNQSCCAPGTDPGPDRRKKRH